MTTYTDNADYPNVRNKIDQKYNNKIETMKSLIQCDCIFILKYYKNVIQKQDCELNSSLNDGKREYIENPITKM